MRIYDSCCGWTDPASGVQIFFARCGKRVGFEEAIVRAASLLETFFNEAAVLWFVFPVLDAIYESRAGVALGAIAALKIVVQSWCIALLFFYFAVLSKRLEDDMKGKIELIARINKRRER